MNLQGSSFQVQKPSKQSVQSPAPVNLQPATDVRKYVDPVANSAPQQAPGAGTSFTQAAAPAVDPAVAAAAAKAAADAQKAASLRGEVTNLVNSIKDIFNSRYGMVDTLAGEQTGKLNERFGNESQDITNQVENTNQQIGAAHAASGTFDSSYRGNNVDTITHAGQGQIRDLGTELHENIAKIASWVASQKGGFNAEKGGMDAVLAHLAEEQDPERLTDLRNTLDGRIANLRGGQAEYNSAGANAQSLATIAPSSARAVQLKTTLSQVLGGNADSSQKAAIGQRLIESAGLSPDEKQQLLTGFSSDLQTTDKTKKPTA